MPSPQQQAVIDSATAETFTLGGLHDTLVAYLEFWARLDIINKTISQPTREASSMMPYVTPEGVLSGLSFALTVWSYVLLCGVVARGLEDSNIVTWVVAIVLGAIAFAGQFSVGGVFALVVSASQAIGAATILIVTLRHYGRHPLPGVSGVRRWIGPVEKSDWWMLALSGMVTIAYVTTNSPVLAIVLAIIADALGMQPTARLAYKAKDGEFPLSPWWMDAGAGFLGTAAVAIGDGMDWGLIALPLYLLLVNLAVVGAYYLGQWRLARLIPRASTLVPMD
jgi:hypothetical protein